MSEWSFHITAQKCTVQLRRLVKMRFLCRPIIPPRMVAMGLLSRRSGSLVLCGRTEAADAEDVHDWLADKLARRGRQGERVSERRGTDASPAERMVREALAKARWREIDLATQPKGHRLKVRIAQHPHQTRRPHLFSSKLFHRAWDSRTNWAIKSRSFGNKNGCVRSTSSSDALTGLFARRERA